jgi:hypothetical protein
MSKIQAGASIDLMTFSMAEAKVGDYKWSALDETAFGDEHLGEWKLCNGQSCTGTAYQQITGQSTVPNALTDGAFIRQAKAGRTLGSFEDDATALPNNAFSGTADSSGAHTHTARISNSYGGNANSMVASNAGSGGTNTTSSGSGVVNTSSSGAHTHTLTITGGDTETRPNNIALNLYVKVGY